MHGGHQTLDDAELLVQDLGDGSQAVGGAGGVGHEGHVRGVLVVVDAHDEHRGVVLGGSAHDDVLGAGVDVALAQVLAQVLAGALADILSADRSPGDVLDVHGGEHGVLLAVDHQSTVLSGDLAGELAVNAVVLQHIGHILGVHEGVVQTDDFHIVVGQGSAENEAADTAETIDTDLGFHSQKTPFKFDGTENCRQNVCANVLLNRFTGVYYHTEPFLATVISNNNLFFKL